MQESNAGELQMNLDVLAKRLGLALPAGTQVVHVETESGIDDAIFAKLRVPSTRADDFIRSLHVTRFQHGAADLFGPDRGAWDPHQAKALRVGDVLLPSTRGLVVGLDESRADALVVYVLNHGT
jgi:hypothetical protein